MKRAGIFGGGLVLVFTLAASVWTYRASLDRLEVVVAENQSETVTTNPFNLSGFTKQGRLKVHAIGDVYLAYRFIHKGKTYNYKTNPGGNVPTVFSVKPGETVKLTVCVNQYCDFAPYGWLPPTAPNTRNCSADTRPIVKAVKAAGEKVLSVQCWQDNENDTDPWDDFELVITQLPAASPSPSPSPAASPTPPASPQPSPSPSPAVSPSPSPSVNPSPSSSPSPAASPQSSPSPQPLLNGGQPATGTPTWLTLFLIFGIMVITVIKVQNAKT